MAFKNISNQVHFPELECEILDFWQRSDIFKKSLDQRRGGREFVFYDGPPFATGLPHYGHLLAGTIIGFSQRIHDRPHLQRSVRTVLRLIT